MSGGTYRVVVTREDGHWLADVPSLEGATPSLAACQRWTRQ